MRGKSRTAIAPPTEKQLAQMQQYVKSCLHVDGERVCADPHKGGARR